MHRQDQSRVVGCESNSRYHEHWMVILHPFMCNVEVNTLE